MNANLLSVDDVALMFNVHQTTALRWVKTGKLKATVYRQGTKRRYIISREDLDVFIKKYDMDQCGTSTESEGSL